MLWFPRKWAHKPACLGRIGNFQADEMFFHKAPLAFIIFFLVAAVLFFCFLAYFYLWMCCRKRYRLKEQKKSATMEKKANEQRFHDLAKPDDNEEAKGNKFYPIVFHNKKQETAELRLLWIKEEQQFIAEFSSRGNLMTRQSVSLGFYLAFIFWQTWKKFKYVKPDTSVIYVGE